MNKKKIKKFLTKLKRVKLKTFLRIQSVFFAVVLAAYVCFVRAASCIALSPTAASAASELCAPRYVRPVSDATRRTENTQKPNTTRNNTHSRTANKYAPQPNAPRVYVYIKKTIYFGNNFPTQSHRKQRNSQKAIGHEIRPATTHTSMHWGTNRKTIPTRHH